MRFGLYLGHPWADFSHFFNFEDPLVYSISLILFKIEKMTKIHPGMTEIQVKTHGHSKSKWKSDSPYRQYGESSL